MTRTKKLLAALGFVAAVGTPVGVHATTRAETGKNANVAHDETITCPLTGEQITPSC